MNKKIISTAIISASFGFALMFVISQLHHFEFGFHDHDHDYEHGVNMGDHIENSFVPETPVVSTEQEFLGEVIEQLEIIDRQSALLISAVPAGDTTALVSDLQEINKTYLTTISQFYIESYGEVPEGGYDAARSDFRSIMSEWSENEKERVFLEDMILYLENLSQTLVSLRDSTDEQMVRDESDKVIEAISKKQREIQEQINRIPNYPQ